jgi:hypothetical protein
MDRTLNPMIGYGQYEASARESRVPEAGLVRPALEFGAKLTGRQPFPACWNDGHVLYVVDSEQQA